jgi:hypothetical protein
MNVDGKRLPSLLLHTLLAKWKKWKNRNRVGGAWEKNGGMA